MNSLSAKKYFLIFSGVGLIIFFLLSANQFYRTETVRQAIEAEKLKGAKLEMVRAVGRVAVEVSRITETLAQWDEVHQQLFDPTYYVYWRETRSKNKEYLPDYVVGFELYDQDGQALVRMQNREMPANVPEQRLFVQSQTGELFAFHAIKSRVVGDELVGYLGIKVDFLKLLRLLNKFILIQDNSLDLKLSFTPLVVSELSEKINYQLLDDTVESPLGAMVNELLRDYFFLFIFIIVVFYILVSFVFIKPLEDLNAHIHTLRSGGRESGVAPRSMLPALAELDATWESLNNYHNELNTTRMELDNRNAELWELAHVDSLTGINNRMAFDRDWAELMNVARNTRLDISLALFDCDFFKAINDTYGHEKGDQVIQAIATNIQDVLREGDTLYRLGGDEFLAIFIDCDEKQAERVTKRCVSAVQENAAGELGIKEGLILSVGLAYASGDDTANLSELPRQADVAMYHAKGATRNKVVHYSLELEQDSYAMVTTHVVSAVLEALEHGTNMLMHYQPIVDTFTGEVSHYEALVRITDSDGLITPADIFPIVTRRRLEVELDKAVLRSVKADLSSGNFPPGIGVAINVSPAILALNDFCELFSEFLPFLQRHPIIIEVTETTLITHLQHASECLEKMRKQGFLVALDDFGSGYSSLRYLANMPVDIVKFDISMVRSIQHDERSRNIIYDTAGLIHNAGYKLVAEGIEDETTRQAVMPIHPHYLQGYLYDRPKPLHALVSTPSYKP